jgi:hypothetical protein
MSVGVRRVLVVGLCSLGVVGGGGVFGGVAWAASPPEAVTEPASGVSSSAATLNGSVNPGGVPLLACQFEYGLEELYGSVVACAQTPAEIGSGTSPVAVSAALSGLLPGTTYHFRLLVENELGEVAQGADQTVGTLVAAPALTGEWSVNVGSVDADLRAGINPDGADTTYRFEYGPTAAYGASVPVPDGDLGSGTAQRVVGVHVAGLAGGAVYHYRVVASNSAGTLHGPDHLFRTFAVSAPAAVGDANEGSCANEALSGFSPRLPDCRSYELVSAVDKEGGDIASFGSINFTQWQNTTLNQQAAADGNGAIFTSLSSFGAARGAPPLSEYRASRGAGGWSGQPISLPQEPAHNPIEAGAVTPFHAFSSDLSVGIAVHQDPPLAAGAKAHEYNLYRDDLAGGALQLLAPANSLTGASFVGASTDFSHIVYQYESGGVYEWSSGQAIAVSALPDGTTVNGAVGLPSGGGFSGSLDVANAVSADGSRVFWSAETGFETGQLYVRLNGVSTVKVSASQRSPSLGDGSASFVGAAADGSRVFFTDATALTSDPNDTGGGLYEFDVASGRLTDLTPDGAGPGIVGVLGVSEDGSTVYFVATGGLAGGASVGADNLYVARGGQVSFIATLSGADNVDWSWKNTSPKISFVQPVHTARVSADGGVLAFVSQASLTGYDNTVASGTSCGFGSQGEKLGVACPEVFLYDAGTARVSCASCNPSGARPLGASSLPPWNNPYAVGLGVVEAPGVTYQSRFLSGDGSRLFFDTFDALTPRDVNGRQDVYVYEGGRVYPISSGTGSDDSTFVDASVDGSDVFFMTRSQLVSQDQDQNVDLYDARVNGGFPGVPPSVPCTGEACRGVVGAPAALPGLASELSSGPGNIVPVVVKPVAQKRPKVKKKPRKPRRRRHGKGAGAHARGKRASATNAKRKGRG